MGVFKSFYTESQRRIYTKALASFGDNVILSEIIIFE